MISFLGCSSIPRIEFKVIESDPIPLSYFELPDCNWDGDETYQGMIEYIKLLQKCLEKEKMLINQIKQWELDQKEIIKKKKQELGMR